MEAKLKLVAAILDEALLDENENSVKKIEENNKAEENNKGEEDSNIEENNTVDENISIQLQVSYFVVFPFCKFWLLVKYGFIHRIPAILKSIAMQVKQNQSQSDYIIIY